MSTPTGHTFKVYMQSLKWAQSGILSGWPQYHVTVAVSLGKFLGDGDANGRQIPRPWKGGEPPSAQGPARGPTRGQVPRMTSQIDCHPHRLLINLLPLVSGRPGGDPYFQPHSAVTRGLSCSSLGWSVDVRWRQDCGLCAVTRCQQSLGDSLDPHLLLAVMR